MFKLLLGDQCHIYTKNYPFDITVAPEATNSEDGKKIKCSNAVQIQEKLTFYPKNNEYISSL